MALRAGGLCFGYGGLELGLSEVLDVDLAWYCEVDQAASAVAKARWHAPNHDDITTVDWRSVEPVDVLTAGYPCQPFSHAGNRKGTTDARHLWPHVARAISVLRPRLVILENVAGHLSLGFDRVTADLAGLGYVGSWGVVRASDVGACHRRARLFVVATDATSDQGGGPPRRQPRCSRRRS